MLRHQSDIRRYTRTLYPALPYTWEAPDILGEGGLCNLSTQPISNVGWLGRLGGLVTDRSRYFKYFNLMTQEPTDQDGVVGVQNYRFLDGGIILSVGQATLDMSQALPGSPDEIEAAIRMGQELLDDRHDPNVQDYYRTAQLLSVGVAQYNNGSLSVEA